MTVSPPAAQDVPPAASPPPIAARYDVLIVGAGLAGIGAACRLRAHDPAASWAIVEARATLGGTWDGFRYPGVRADSDMAALAYPFRPWRGEAMLPGGDMIRGYIADTARSHGVDAHIHYGHRVTAARWSRADALWTVELRVGDRTVTTRCAFLFSCTGYFDHDRGHAPRWPGMENFGGRIVHPQHWPADMDHAGARIVVIGSGATAVTLVPALAATAGHVTMLQRSPSYIVARPTHDAGAARLRRWLPHALTGTLADRMVRWRSIGVGMLAYGFARRWPERMKRLIRDGVVQGLGTEHDVDRHFAPRYDPWDERLCLAADGDLFAVLRDGRAAMATGTIDRFTPTGLRLNDGTELDADLVVTATGLSLKLFGGIDLVVDGQPVDASTRMVYRGAMIEGVPNFAFAFGYGSAAWTLGTDLAARFVVRMLRSMKRRAARIVTPVAVPDASEGTIPREPLIPLRSGYVLRDADRFPKAGPGPWRARRSYLRDRIASWARLRDGVLRFERGG